MHHPIRAGIPWEPERFPTVATGTPAAGPCCPTCGQPWAKTPRPPRPAPCPPGARRHRLACWRAWGLLPDGLAPAAIAAAFTRATGRLPAGDPQRRAIRAYSPRELGLALAELGHPTPPPDPLPSIWAAALQALPLPSTRMMLSQRARLLALEPSPYRLAAADELLARVAVASDWLEMAGTRVTPLANALTGALGQPVAVELQAVEVER